jgi:hypothetical protein
MFLFKQITHAGDLSLGPYQHSSTKTCLTDTIILIFPSALTKRSQLNSWERSEIATGSWGAACKSQPGDKQCTSLQTG